MGSRFGIAVTEQDIGSAERNVSTHCAVAQAIYRNIPGVSHVDVDIQTIRFSLLAEGVRRAYLTPPSVQEYIVAFDAGDKIEPFAFTLYRPAWEMSTKRHAPAEAVIAVAEAESAPVEKVRLRARLPKRSTVRVYGRRVMRANLAVGKETDNDSAK